MAKGITLVIPQRTVVYTGIALVVAVIVILNVYAFFISGGREGSGSKSVEKTAENFASAKAAEIPDDKCKAPPGYTDEQWREHMGHHPDQYEECL